MPFIYFALEFRPDAGLLPNANVCQGSAALPGRDHECVHWLQTHAQTVTNYSRRSLAVITNVLVRERERERERESL
jgi:gluconate kinase